MVLLAWLVTWLPGAANAGANELPGRAWRARSPRRGAARSPPCATNSRFTVPADRTARVTGRNVVHVQLRRTRPVRRSCSTSTRRPRRSRRSRSTAWCSPPVVANGHLVIAAAHLKRRRQHHRRVVRRRRRPAQPGGRLPLHAVRPGAGAPGVSLLRPARPQGARVARARPPRGLARRRQRGGAEPGRARRRAFTSPSRETAPLPTYLFAFAAGQVPGRDRRTRTAASSGCSTARPTPRSWRATAR